MRWNEDSRVRNLSLYRIWKAAIYIIILFFPFLVVCKKGHKEKVNSGESLNMRKVFIHKTYQWNYKGKAKETVTWKKFSVLNPVLKSLKPFRSDPSFARSIGRTLLAFPLVFFWTALTFCHFSWTVKGYIYVEVTSVHYKKILLESKETILNKWWRKYWVLLNKSAYMEPSVWATLAGELGHGWKIT